MKPSCEELEARVSELSKALDVSLSVQRDLAKRMGEMLLEIKRAESAIGSLGWMSLDTAISLELSKLNKQISDLQGQVRALTEQRDALVVEMKSAFEKPQAYLTWHAIPPTWEDTLPCGEYLDVHDTDGHKNSDGTDCWPVYAKPETPATDAFLAEVRAQESKRVYESILDNPAVTDMESLVDWLEQNANDSVAFAAQLRKGVQS
ncbi:TPA: hypothetical protein SCS24_001215 [Enterobacter kobei]|nr:hypothetical protein [Enterobacter kobei]HEG2021374.1 hypothetical protein [Enterobacter kobei]